jgi:hypothetical protein
VTGHRSTGRPRPDRGGGLGPGRAAHRAAACRPPGKGAGSGPGRPAGASPRLALTGPGRRTLPISSGYPPRHLPSDGLRLRPSP